MVAADALHSAWACRVVETAAMLLRQSHQHYHQQQQLEGNKKKRENALRFSMN